MISLSLMGVRFNFQCVSNCSIHLLMAMLERSFVWSFEQFDSAFDDYGYHVGFGSQCQHIRFGLRRLSVLDHFEDRFSHDGFGPCRLDVVSHSVRPSMSIRIRSFSSAQVAYANRVFRLFIRVLSYLTFKLNVYSIRLSKPLWPQIFLFHIGYLYLAG